MVSSWSPLCEYAPPLMHSWAGGGVMWWLTQVGLLIVRQLTETKGKNTQFTILHFLKKEVQTKKEHLLSFYDELPNVEKASKRTCVRKDACRPDQSHAWSVLLCAVCMEHIIMEVQKIKKDLTQLERELAVRKEEKDKLSAEQPPAPEDHYCELMGVRRFSSFLHPST